MAAGSLAALGLTPWAVGTGTLFGAVLAAANLWFGLQTGWVTMASLQAAMLAWLLRRSAVAAGWAKHWTPAELAVSQTISVAAATVPLAAGFVAIIPALSVLSPDDGGPLRLDAGQQAAWTVAMCGLGVALALPLRKLWIKRYPLRFPSGLATSEMVASLVSHDAGAPGGGRRQATGDGDAQPLLQGSAAGHTQRGGLPGSKAHGFSRARSDSSASEGAEFPAMDAADLSSAVEGAARPAPRVAPMWVCMGAAAVMTILTHGIPVLGHIPVIGLLGAGAAPAQYGWTFTPSLAYVGQGVLMGMHTVLSMLLGAVLGWGVLGPVATQHGWATWPPEDRASGAAAWLGWVSLGLMLGDAMATVVAMLLFRGRQHGHAGPAGGVVELHAAGEPAGSAHAHPAPGHDVPATPPAWWHPAAWHVTGMKFWLGAALASAAILYLVVGISFDVRFTTLTLAILLSGLVALLCTKALGETDLNPVSGVGKVAQAALFPVSSSVVASLLAGALAEAVAQQSGDLLQAFRVGNDLHVSPAAQFLAQLLGTAVGLPATLLAWQLYTSAYQVPGPTLPAPSAALWQDMADLASGKASLPPHIVPAMAIAAGTAWALSMAKAWARSGPHASGTRAVLAHAPSSVAMGVGMYITPNWVLPRVLGGLVALVWSRRWAESWRASGLLAATGMVLGEVFMAIFYASLGAAGHAPSPWTCAGCGALGVACATCA